MVLEAGLAPGTPLGEVAGLCDVVFEIDNQSVTHRPDLWGHYGFARELAALLGRELRPLDLDGDLRAVAPGSGPDAPSITLEDAQGCPLYVALCLAARSGASPDWMRFRLAACGMRPLGLLVDLSNYVMLELGQPTHPFDRATLDGDAIVVRAAHAGETLTTLDEVERTLEPDDLVIADGRRAVALAGIMGGRATEVGTGTRRLLLESASFDPVRVRRTSGRLGLRTEAIARFEKALDPGLAEQAVRRYARLLRQVDPEAELPETFAVTGSASAPECRVRLPAGKVAAVLGRPVSDEEIVATLESVGFACEADPAGGFAVDVPAWRSSRDVTIAEDLVEEVGRLMGYDAVPTSEPSGRLLVGTRGAVLAVEERLRDALAERCAFTESLSYSMVADRDLSAAGWDEGRPLPRLARPLQQDAARLRPSLVPGMLGRLEPWLRHSPEVRVFEVGRGYALRDGDVVETREVAALLARAGRDDAAQVLRVLKGVAEAALAALGRPAPDWSRLEPGPDLPWMHPKQSAGLSVGGAPVGRLGAVSPEVMQRLGVDGAAALLVLDAEALARVPEGVARYEEIGRFPSLRIDLAFVAGASLEVAQMRAAMLSAGPRTLRAVVPFDVYRGPPLGADERSIAFHLVFQARDRTLTDDDVAAARERIIAAIEKLGARLR